MSANLSLFTAPVPPRRRWSALLLIERGLLLVALSTLGYVAGTMGGAALYQDYESRQLDAVLRAGADRAAPASGTLAAPRSVIGRIDIPRLGVSTIIKEGEDASTLRLAVGHIRGTALPGAAGNMGLAGHRDTFFRRLEHIAIGDVIRLAAPEGSFTYVVERTSVVQPDDVWVLDPTPEPALTLVTCFPFAYVGSAPERFIVHARLVPEPSSETPSVEAAVWRPAASRPTEQKRTRAGEPRHTTGKARRPPSRTEAAAPPATDAEVVAPISAPPPRPARSVKWLHTTRGH